MGRLVRIAGDGEVALQHLPRLVGKAGAVRGAGEEALGDLAGAAPADPGDAGDREDVLHEGLGGLGRLALDGGEETRMLLGTRPVLFGEARQALSRDDGADHPTLGGRRNPESIDQGMKQAHVAELHLGAGPPNCFRPSSARARISASAAETSGRPIGFEARLQELAALARAHAEDRAAIGIAGGLGTVRVRDAGGRRGSCIRAAGTAPRRPHPASRTCAAGYPRPRGR